MDSSPAYIDPTVNEDLVVALEALSPTVDTAESQVALRTVLSQLSSGRSLNPAPLLLELEGPACIISALLSIAMGEDSEANLANVKPLDSQLAEELSLSLIHI